MNIKKTLLEIPMALGLGLLNPQNALSHEQPPHRLVDGEAYSCDGKLAEIQTTEPIFVCEEPKIIRDRSFIVQGTNLMLPYSDYSAADLSEENPDQYFQDRKRRTGIRTKDNAIFAAKRTLDERNSVYLGDPSKLKLSAITASCSLNKVVVTNNNSRFIYCEK